ncbi:MAG: hypothetical protein IAE89_15425 [Anaerolineae bacterium]|nr:hypothetical protein [Anaerolineae bacterium]
MTATPIPPRQPIEDRFSGFVIAAGAQNALAMKGVSANVTARGSFVIRYGIRFMGKPHIAIVPGLVAVDYGQILNSDAAWNFLIKRSNLYPRAEVFGFRNDGKDDMVYVKNLDFALPVAVLVYADAEATTPICSPDALITTLPDTIPERLKMHLPLFENTEEWLAASP